MRYSCAVASLIYCLTGNAQEYLVVQSNAVASMYDNTIVEQLAYDSGGVIPVFNARDFTFDRSHRSRLVLTGVLEGVASVNGSSVLVYLEEPVTSTEHTEHFVPLLSSSTTSAVALRAASISNEDWTPIYVISDPSDVAARRFAWLEGTGLEFTQFKVKTISEMRARLFSLNSEPKGTVVLNAFVLLDEWNKPVSYPTIEREFVSARSKHVEVGVCIPNFTTMFALGPSRDEAVAIVRAALSKGKPPVIGSCVNIKRAADSRVYHSVIGRFDRVK